TAVNDAPTLSAVTGVTTYVAAAAAVAASPALSAGEADNLTLVNATVSVGNGFPGDGALLSFSTPRTAHTGPRNAATQRVGLAALAFSGSRDNPANYGSNLSRVLTWVVNDGSASNNTNAAQFTTVVVTAVNDAPTLTGVPGSEGFAPGHTITMAPHATLSDVD